MLKLFFSLIFVLLFPFMAQGASLNIVINEIAWMGTIVFYNDEWLELYNNSELPVSLDGWILKTADEKLKINLSGTVPANGFYLLERTDDETVPGISADLIYKGALANEGENLKLYDNLGNLIDEVNFGDGWPAGDNKTKQTMERAKDGTWQTSAEPSGTPKEINSIINITIPLNKRSSVEETLPPIIETEKEVEDGPLLNYPTGIVFNEILPSPEGVDAESEWIEIFNQNNFEIDLVSWQVKDKEGKITTYNFPEGTKISPLGYLVLKRPETKITLNNSGDGLEIINPNGEIIDSVNFEKAPLRQSYNKTQSGWAWSTILTPEKENIIPSPLPQIEQKPSLTKVSEGKKETAAISEKIPQSKLSKSPAHLYVLLIAFALAIFSAIIIIILKRL